MTDEEKELVRGIIWAHENAGSMVLDSDDLEVLVTLLGRFIEEDDA